MARGLPGFTERFAKVRPTRSPEPCGRAGFEYFRNLERDAEDFARMAQTRLAMPMLVLSGEKAGGTFLIEQAKMVASDVRGQVVKGSGHWLMEEAPKVVIPALIDFLG